MRVLLVHSSAQLYGSDRALVNICKALKGRAVVRVLLPESGPLVAVLEAEGAEVAVMDVPVIRRRDLRPLQFPVFVLGLLRSYLRLLRYVREAAPDVVHANTVAVFWVCYLRFLYPRARYVTHVREIFRTDGWRGMAGRAVYRQVARHSDAVVAISRDVRDAVASAAPGCASRLTLITDGLGYLGGARAARPRDDVRRELGISPDAAVIICVARINAWKGQDVLLDAFGLLRPGFPDARLLIVGDAFRGYEYLAEGLRRKAEDMGMSGAVTFTGFREDVADLLGASDVFVLPSVRPEPFGLVVLEAMAAGLPVVATDGGGPRETVQDGVTGILVPFSDPAALAAAAVRLLSDPVLRESMGTQGRRYLDERFPDRLDATGLMAAYGFSSLHGFGQEAGDVL
ncbi:MAG: glycosyltransferase family 4 protein [Nitrospirae bacterium]|nr:glycosyltransferase family 4 protein [Nitrospirota bacterium]